MKEENIFFLVFDEDLSEQSLMIFLKVLGNKIKGKKPPRFILIGYNPTEQTREKNSQGEKHHVFIERKNMRLK